jgi:hypothetical protein
MLSKGWEKVDKRRPDLASKVKKDDMGMAIRPVVAPTWPSSP